VAQFSPNFNRQRVKHFQHSGSFRLALRSCDYRFQSMAVYEQEFERIAAWADLAPEPHCRLANLYSVKAAPLRSWPISLHQPSALVAALPSRLRGSDNAPS
jgi:hypothetical protein